MRFPEKAADLRPQSSAATVDASLHVTTFTILFAVSFCHLLNDMMQSLLSALYPSLKATLELNFAQVGLITATYHLTASLLQPLVGLYSDKGRLPFSLPVSMMFPLVGLLALPVA